MNFFYYYCQGFGFCHIAIDKKNKQLNRTPNPQLKRKKTNKKKRQRGLANTFAQKTCSEFQFERSMFWKVINTSKQDF